MTQNARLPADLSDNEARRANRRAVLRALPAIGLVTVVLWSVLSALALSLSILIDLEIVGLGIVILLLLPPGLWANWQAIRLSVAAERELGS